MLFQKFILTGFINMDYWNVLLIDIYSSILSTWLLFFAFAWAKPLWVPSYMSAAIFQSITDARPFLLGDGSGKPEQPQKAHVNAWTGKPLCSCSFPQSGVLQAMTPLESEWWSGRNSEREISEDSAHPSSVEEPRLQASVPNMTTIVFLSTH